MPRGRPSKAAKSGAEPAGAEAATAEGAAATVETGKKAAPQADEAKAGSGQEPDDEPIVGLPVRPYHEGALCRSLDQGKLYEAKIVRVGADDQYFIHYQGWNKKWDKWVHATLLIPEGPEAEKLAKRLVEQERRRKDAREKAKKGAEDAKAKDREANKTSKKPRVDYGRALEPFDPSAPELKIPLPLTLKRQLVQDWERVTQMDPQMLVSLPRSPTAHEIINMYAEQRMKKTNAKAQVKIQELYEGLRVYFDAALPVTLLYAKERHQFLEACRRHPDKPPSQVYGGEHLLRLFTKLPAILGRASLAPVEATQVSGHLADFLKFMQKHSATVFTDQFEPQLTQPQAQPAAAASSSKGNEEAASEGGAAMDTDAPSSPE